MIRENDFGPFEGIPQRPLKSGRRSTGGRRGARGMPPASDSVSKSRKPSAGSRLSPAAVRPSCAAWPGWGWAFAFATADDLVRAATRLYWAAARIGTCALRKLRTRLMVRAFSSGGSLHGNTVISAFGAQRGDIDRGLQRMRGRVVRQDQHRCLAIAR